MGLTDWLLALHLLAAFALISALVIFSVVVVAGGRDSRPTAVAPLFAVARVGNPLVAVGMAGTVVFGVWLALRKPPYHLYDPWILAALVLWAGAAETGRRTGAAYDEIGARARTLSEGDDRDLPSPELAGLLQETPGRRFHWITCVLALAILLLMIFKPGA
jgi:hypothetical protein